MLTTIAISHIQTRTITRETIVLLDLQRNGPRYLWWLRGKVVRQDEGEIGCTLHFQSVFVNGREEPMKFSFVRSLWNHLRFHVQTDKKYKPPSRCYYRTPNDSFFFYLIYVYVQRIHKTILLNSQSKHVTLQCSFRVKSCILKEAIPSTLGS